jgi:hypothetical protein
MRAEYSVNLQKPILKRGIAARRPRFLLCTKIEQLEKCSKSSQLACIPWTRGSEFSYR